MKKNITTKPIQAQISSKVGRGIIVPSFSFPSKRYNNEEEKVRRDEYSNKMTFYKFSGADKEKLKNRLIEYRLKGGDIQDVIIKLEDILDFALPIEYIPVISPTITIHLGTDKEKKKKWPKWIGRIIAIGSAFLSIFLIFLAIYGLSPLISTWSDDKNFLTAVIIRLLFVIGTAGIAISTIMGGIYLVARKCENIL